MISSGRQKKLKTKTFKGATLGLSSGLFWAIDTILIGYILSTATFMSFAEIALAAPLISTFLHDAMSAIWMMILLGIKGELLETIKKFKTRSGLFVVLAATLGGPVGMTFYVLSVQNIGASFTATISSIYPAVGAFFAFILLKDKLSLKNWAGLLTSILSITLLSYSGNLISGTTVSIGLIFILLCVFGWGMESVIVAYGMKEDQISPIQALLIRQLTSAAIFGALIVPLFVGHSFTGQVLNTNATWLIALIALAGTLSYIFYYQAINLVGPVRAMGLNISYAAWAILIDVLILGGDFSVKNMVFAALIMIGSIFTVMENKKKQNPSEDDLVRRQQNPATAFNK
jgi:drug/metabolite transporter (DMT)-like permease